MNVRDRVSLRIAGVALTVLAAAGCTAAVESAPAPPAQPASVASPAPAPAAANGIGSVMVQVSSLGPTYSPATVAGWFTEFCAAKASSGDLVLQDVAPANGPLATSYLDAIAPFFPGGSSACFSRVFVGTVDLQWTGSGTKYIAGIQDPAFTDLHLARSQTAAAEFVARYPSTPINWYLTYEASLNDFFYPEVASAYESLLSREIAALTSIRAGKFAWSPAFWYPHSTYSQNTAGMAQLRTNLAQFFTSLRNTTAGIQQVDLQDFVAGSSCQPLGNRVTADDAVAWANLLRNLNVIPEVAMNVEQYAINCATGVNVAGSQQEIADRTARYQANGITLGAAFEIRYWAAINGS